MIVSDADRMLVALTMKLIPKEVLERNRKQSESIWEDGKPQKWYYAIPIVLTWLIILGCLLKVILWR